MSEVKHLPGPWFAGVLCGPEMEETISIGPFEKEVHYEDSICEVWHGNYNAVANAKLIAAAPELLEALEGLVDSIECAGWHPSHVEQAKEVIAKAKGVEA